MEQKFGQSESKKYVEKKIDTDRSDLIDALNRLNHLSNPRSFVFTEQSRSEAGITEKYQYHDLTVTARYNQIRQGEPLPKNLSKFLNYLSENKIIIEPEELLRVSNFTIRRKDHRLIIWDFLPKPDYLLLMAGNRFNRLKNCFDPDNKIIISSYLFSPEGIISFAHECGHAQIYESLSPSERGEHNRLAGPHNYFRLDFPEVANILHLERSAWAWALKTLKPFLSKDREYGLATYRDVKNFIHKYALASYGQAMAEKIEEEMRKEQASLEVEF